MKHLDSPDVGSTIPHKAAVSKMSATKDTSTTTTTTTTTSTTTTTTTTNTTNTNTTSSNVEAGHPMSESAVLESTCKATASVGCCAPDRLWFAVADESACSEVVFILDPGTEAGRPPRLVARIGGHRSNAGAAAVGFAESAPLPLCV
ncbi:hypothetical protein ECG_07505 [Echinococcus granulosus]|nr:hypothetical protein ECG_07505 [Echinococcus granulosus]